MAPYRSILPSLHCTASLTGQGIEGLTDIWAMERIISGKGGVATMLPTLEAAVPQTPLCCDRTARYMIRVCTAVLRLP